MKGFFIVILLKYYARNLLTYINSYLENQKKMKYQQQNFISK